MFNYFSKAKRHQRKVNRFLNRVRSSQKLSRSDKRRVLEELGRAYLRETEQNRAFRRVVINKAKPLHATMLHLGFKPLNF